MRGNVLLLFTLASVQAIVTVCQEEKKRFDNKDIKTKFYNVTDVTGCQDYCDAFRKDQSTFATCVHYSYDKEKKTCGFVPDENAEMIDAPSRSEDDFVAGNASSCFR